MKYTKYTRKISAVTVIGAFCVIATMLLVILSACSSADSADTGTNADTVGTVENQNLSQTEESGTQAPKKEIEIPEKSQQIRVYECGKENVKLFPDGTFIANIFHNTKITGTYTELEQDGEIAVLFSYNGITTYEDDIGTFELTGYVTVVGGIVDGVMTIPEDWNDEHEHDLAFVYREYPVTFASDDGQKITLYADNTFTASFSDNVTVIGFYAMRKATITFVPASPFADIDGVITGPYLIAQLNGIDEAEADHDHEDDDHDDEHDEDHDGDEDNDDHSEDSETGEDEHEEDSEEPVVTLTLPELWLEASGGSEFTLIQ